MMRKERFNMSVLKAFFIAFSIYSKIPVPIFNWEEKDMKYHLIFFPWIGAIIGAVLVGWRYLATYAGVGDIAYVLVATAIPLAITGGFHVDGYMDTMDAFRSYKSKEEKLKILKDPHIGAFSVIMLALLGFIYIAAFSEIDKEVLVVYAASFYMARCLSGIAVIVFPSAKSDGMMHTFSSTVKGAKGIVLALLVIQFVLGGVYMIALNPIVSAILIAVALVAFAYYWYKTRKELGGITGDTAGFFVTVAETAMAVAVAICSAIL